MYTTRLSIVNDILAFVGELGDSDARTVVESILPRALERIWLKHPWSAFVLPNPLTVTTVAGVRAYALQPIFGRIGPGKVRNLSTGGSVLEPATQEQLMTENPAAGTAFEQLGAPYRYSSYGLRGVLTQPTNAYSIVSAASSSATDTDVNVTIVGLDENGAYKRGTITLNGTNPVDFTGYWSEVWDFSKSFASTVTGAAAGTSSRGTVTLRGLYNLAFTTLQALALDESSRQHPLIILDPTPDTTGHVISVPTIRALTPPIYDSDQIPAHWGPMVFEEMLAQWLVYNNEIPSEASVPRPAFLDAVSYDIMGRLGIMSTRKRGFTG